MFRVLGGAIFVIHPHSIKSGGKLKLILAQQILNNSMRIQSGPVVRVMFIISATKGDRGKGEIPTVRPEFPRHYGCI